MVYHRRKAGEADGNARYLCMETMDFDPEGNILPIRMTNGWQAHFD